MKLLAWILIAGRNGLLQAICIMFIIWVCLVSASDLIQYDKTKEAAKQDSKSSLLGAHLSNAGKEVRPGRTRINFVF